MSGEEREKLGRLVRETWVAWAGEQPDPKESWLLGWDDLRDDEREVDMRIGEAVAEVARSVSPAPNMPPAVADFGPVRLELMGHRYREGHLSEVVIAGQPFLRLEPSGGAPEFYRPDAVYCLTPVVATIGPVPLAAIPERFADVLDDADDYAGEEDPF